MTGYLGLFASALLAATILPFSSEAMLGALLLAGEHEPLGLLIAASIGNTLGSVVNWGLGRFCLRWRERRWFPVKPTQLERATRWFASYGVWSLLLAWVPVVGDPLTVAAGLLRVRFTLFLLLVAIGKTGRYIFVVYLVNEFAA